MADHVLGLWVHLDLGDLRDAFHLEPHEVVREQDSPELLFDALARLAADGLLAIEELRLQLVVPELQLPTFVT